MVSRYVCACDCFSTRCALYCASGCCSPAFLAEEEEGHPHLHKAYTWWKYLFILKTWGGLSLL